METAQHFVLVSIRVAVAVLVTAGPCRRAYLRKLIFTYPILPPSPLVEHLAATPPHIVCTPGEFGTVLLTTSAVTAGAQFHPNKNGFGDYKQPQCNPPRQQLRGLRLPATLTDTLCSLYRHKYAYASRRSRSHKIKIFKNYLHVNSSISFEIRLRYSVFTMQLKKTKSK